MLQLLTNPVFWQGFVLGGMILGSAAVLLFAVIASDKR